MTDRQRLFRKATRKGIVFIDEGAETVFFSPGGEPAKQDDLLTFMYQTAFALNSKAGMVNLFEKICERKCLVAYYDSGELLGWANEMHFHDELIGTFPYPAQERLHRD